MVEPSAIAAVLVEQFGDRVVPFESRGQHAVCIQPADLIEVLAALTEHPDLSFDMLMDIGGVDYLDYDDREHRFEVAYQLYSRVHNQRFRVKVLVADDTVEVPSLWRMWGLANWMEREVFDLFGIHFRGHPNLRRILCHDDFKGHALRKDYPIDKRQVLSRPVELLLTEEQEWA